MNSPDALDAKLLPADALSIVRTLEERGFETWTVGGGVRDALLGRRMVDWDFASAARPSQIRKAFKRTVPIGIDHGTVGVLKGGRMYEVTTFRRDVEPQGRRAIVQFADTVDEDLSRRDFTFNALAWHPLRPEFRDPFGGVEDLKNGVLRAVGDPGERFREDYLRILRGLRFAGRMGLEVEPSTWAALCEESAGLTVLSRERVREELLKVISATRRPSATLSLYAASGALAVILPPLANVAAAPREWLRTLLTVDALTQSAPMLRVAALMWPVARRDGAASVLTLLRHLRFSNAECDDVVGWVSEPSNLPGVDATGEPTADPAETIDYRRWAAAARPAYRAGRLRLAAARARAFALADGVDPKPTVDAIRRIRGEIHSALPLTVSDLEIDGRDLLRLGLKPGPAMGDVLNALLECVLADPALAERSVLLERAQRLIAEVSP